MRTPRHTEPFPDATSSKAFLKDKILALVRKSYPTIAKIIEGFYSESTDSLLQKDEQDTKLWSKRLTSSANLVNIRLAERMEKFVENIKPNSYRFFIAFGCQMGAKMKPRGVLDLA